MGFLSNLFGAIRAVFGFAAQRDVEKNTPAQRSTAEAEQVQRDASQATKDVAGTDLDQLRKDASE